MISATKVLNVCTLSTRRLPFALVLNVAKRDVPRGDHFYDFCVQEFHLTERRVERQLLVVHGDGLRHTLEVDFVYAGACSA